MHLIRTRFLWAAYFAVSLGTAAHCQDSQSLGDAARQARQQKQDKEAQTGKDANATKTPKVITNEEISSRPGSTAENSGAAAKDHKAVDEPSSSGGEKQSGEAWKLQIQAQEGSISTLQTEINKLNDSIQFAPANCVSGCVQWNERQQQKQQEVERMRSQLDSLREHLQEMQEAARQQGYGSSVYDP
jgi:hypothetical protein